ncbi:hypothetical protein Y032_0139g2096 [Ancylostoma ceylanicum]|uniref:Uncharacterized protein n=1 Tax=Ancylostoma ceylanicum TaxID=53326 RepID=A0A016T4M3_9BILA|nr:hypothetical protein Y032_0139g2096 [Ancylostoma ceylanicum]
MEFQDQTTLTGAFGPAVTPTCFNSNGVNPVIHGLFVLSAVRVQTSGRGERANCANHSPMVTPLFPSRRYTPNFTNK